MSSAENQETPQEQSPQETAEQVLQEVRETWRKHWLFFLLLGIGFVFLGMVAISVPFLATLWVEIAIGVVLIIGGLSQTIHSFWVRDWGGFIMSLLCGVAATFLGLLALWFPAAGILTLTSLLAAFLVVNGVFKIIMSVQIGSSGPWGWLLLSGIVGVVLGAFIYFEFPLSAAWVLGVFLGVDLIFGGWAMIMVALSAKSSVGTNSQ
ncbi:acid-resistance membrane protein [Planctomycetes bacterium Pan216]|uniref:Acid-resistance membrane protein n=1 Tax=Kolteria novifilia TaxID=2527975 RepID=A0A518B3B3_9BACT|nr:acid-resistance membrane protein [Planctomycetes bacterium Pan216]